MSKPAHLNCELGTLAITVQAKFSANLGKVVRIVESLGVMDWPALDGPTHVWMVEVVSNGSFLHYFYPRKHRLDVALSGPVPDCYLRRIVPASDQLRLEFEMKAPKKVLEQMAL